MTTKTSDVFGIHKKVLSYIERDNVDTLFKIALQTEKQILVYGASKQGKTALVSKYCGYDENIIYQLTPETELIDIYQHALREAGVKIRTEYTQGEGSSSSLKLRAKIIASFAIFGSGELSTETAGSSNKSSSEKFEEIPFNINQPQDIAKLLTKASNRKIIILENFHYLTYENQKRFAFDLRAFQELGVRFIILGVWRERNRMLQFNGDLLDRVQEIPVEPWEIDDFRRIVNRGQNLLNIIISDEIFEKCCKLSFSSVGVFQDLIQGICLASGIYQKQDATSIIDSEKTLTPIIREKTESYGDRHKRSLEAIASSVKTTGMEKLYYHIVDVILEGGYDGIQDGITLDTMYKKLISRSKNPSFKSKMVKNAMTSLHKLQSDRGIMPPILYFDENSEVLNISDSTLYFFLKNSELGTFREKLKNLCGNRI